jgi:hypothetical protein
VRGTRFKVLKRLINTVIPVTRYVGLKPWEIKNVLRQGADFTQRVISRVLWKFADRLTFQSGSKRNSHCALVLGTIRTIFLVDSQQFKSKATAVKNEDMAQHFALRMSFLAVWADHFLLKTFGY